MVVAAFAKLAGILRAVERALEQKSGRRDDVPLRHFRPDDAGPYFRGAASQIEILRKELPDLYGDFPEIPVEPTAEMATTPPERWYGRDQLERLARTIEQIIEIRANSKLAPPARHAEAERRVFVSHGRAGDWREVQAYIEKDLGLRTLELAQEANEGRTVLGKLEEFSIHCDSAVIVMTGDDIDAEGQARARENVVHEIGYFQAKYGRAKVCLLHEEGVSIPSNLAGLVYIPFPKGRVSAAFHVLARELKSMYR